MAGNNDGGIVRQLCPTCMRIVRLRWDAEEMGFETYCPQCGAPLTLCSECRRLGGKPCDLDRDSGICWRVAEWVTPGRE